MSITMQWAESHERPFLQEIVVAFFKHIQLFRRKSNPKSTNFEGSRIRFILPKAIDNRGIEIKIFRRVKKEKKKKYPPPPF
mmetsp:Transcript_2870/g.4103  ORF Transcript_2870/g.4103 Transcript_2870/m.4103 type:complete len:81 (+) Transcript_2870:94-336(+)